MTPPMGTLPGTATASNASSCLVDFRTGYREFVKEKFQVQLHISNQNFQYFLYLQFR